MNVYSLEGVIVVILLTICTSAYLRRIPRLKHKRDWDAIASVRFAVLPCRLRVHVAFHILKFAMVQNKVKQKVSLPNGVKPKARRAAATKMKKGQRLKIKPKNPKKVDAYKRDAVASKVINKEIEELISARAQS
uniref:Protein kish-B n=1 Tax=Trichuris muris TaxID=70415 RepID=A0A5S6QKY9_TRIMR